MPAPIPSMRALAASILFSATLAACDLDGLGAPAVSAECASIGARCQHPDGPIGVCQQTECAPGVAPPCYACTPQH